MISKEGRKEAGRKEGRKECLGRKEGSPVTNAGNKARWKECLRRKK